MGRRPISRSWACWRICSPSYPSILAHSVRVRPRSVRIWWSSSGVINPPYMNKTERQRLLSVYGPSYGLHYHDSVQRGTCFYCGDFADTRDHSPPLAWVDSRKLTAWAEDGIPLVLVPSCCDCNSLLGSKPLFTVYERACAVSDTLEKRYEKAAALWTDDEIAEMGESFQRTLKARKADLTFLIDRLRHAQWRTLQHDSFPICV